MPDFPQIEPQRQADMRRRLGRTRVASVIKPPRQAAGSASLYLVYLRAFTRDLRRRDVFVARSEWGNPRMKLLHGAQWEATRSHVCRARNRTSHRNPSWQARPISWMRPINVPLPLPISGVRIEPVKGRDTPPLTGLDKPGQPPSLLTRRDAVLPDCLGLICPKCSWKSMPGPALIMHLPT
jgi:hypothetical protein